MTTHASIIRIDKAAVKAGETFTAYVEFDSVVNCVSLANFALYDAATGRVTSRGRVTALLGMTSPTGGEALVTAGAGAETKYWRVTMTANADVDLAQIYLGVNITGAHNSAGEVSDPTIFKSSNFFIDNQAPVLNTAVAVVNGTRLTLVYTDGGGLDANHPPAASAFGVTANGVAVNVTAVVVNAAANTVTLTLASAVAAGQTVLVSYTDPTAGDDASAVQDLAGNDAASFSGRGVSISSDSTGPTMAASSPIVFSKSTLKSGQSATVTFTFSEAVRGFDLSDVLVPADCTLTNLVASNPTDGASTTWTATLTGKSNVESGSVTLAVNLAGVQDTAGNAGVGTSAASPAVEIKTGLPALLADGGIVVSNPTLKTGESTEVVFTFTEDINGSDFTADDIHLSGYADGWRISNPVSLDSSDTSSSFKATLTPPANSASASTSISVNLGGLRDGGPGGGRYGEGSSPVSETVHANTTRPTLTSAGIDIANAILGVDQTTTVTFNFSQAVSGFDLGDVRAENGTLSNMQALNTDGSVMTGANPCSSTWRAVLTPKDNVTDMSNKLTVDLTGVSNAGGNTGVGSVDSRSYWVHTPRPTLTSVEFADPVLTVHETTTVTFTFSEAVTGFDRSDVTGVPYGRLGTMRALDSSGNEISGDNPSSRTWRATLTPDANAQSGQNKLTVNLAGVSNAAGVTGAGSTESASSYSVDTERPTLAASGGVSFDKSTLKVGETATVTFNFSEPVSGLGLYDLSGYADNATLTDLRAVYPNGSTVGGANPVSATWRATLTPLAGKQSASNTLSVNLAAVSDCAGNRGVGSASSGNFVIDTLAPTVTSFTVVRSQSDGLIATYQVRLVFSEKVSGLTADKLLADNASITNLASSDEGMTWTATLSANPGVEDASNKLQLNLSGVTDVAGNAFAQASAESNNCELDSQPPVFAGAVVNGNRLVLYYTGAGSLNAANKPGVGAFAVRADGALNTVTAVSVDAAAKTVTLSLADSVTYGQTVSVSYTDPTNGDDANAIQDTAGNDAASLAAQAADNNTPSPLPQPAPDTDSDGVANNVEDQAPALAGADKGDDGKGNQGGDGNGDGIPDNRQTNVASANFATGTRGASDSGDSAGYTTLVAGGQNGKPAADGGASTHITSLLQQDTPAGLPKGLDMPTGLTSFSAQLAAGARSESFSLYVSADLGINGYWLKNAGGTWVNLASEAYGGKMVSEGGKLRLDFKITDGSEFDADGLADGSISAQGAAAHMALSLLGQAPDAAQEGFWL